MARPKAAWTPPTREGVGPSRVAVTPGPWSTVQAFLAARLPAVPQAAWAVRLARGEVLDAQGRALAPDAPPPTGQVLWYWRELLHPEPVVPFEAVILHRDAHLLAVDKPPFLPMTPKGRHLHETLLVRMKRATGLDTLVPVHRLDRETAGVVLFSVDPSTRAAYQALFRDRAVHKVYEAVAGWRDDLGARLPIVHRSRLAEREDAFMQMHEVPGEPDAQTRIALMARAGDLARYRLEPVTGRKHQLRAHLAALGIPIVGDRIYPVLQPEPPPGAPPDWHEPLRLLARSVAFDDPLTGRPRRFESRRALALDPPVSRRTP
ncbi:MAG: hypothetical protein RL456_24 [Pseudomonadota bacterium]|jgi:tRNA pseudouridine32 synthase/23S rRNA pseudouridine746 synthase